MMFKTIVLCVCLGIELSHLDNMLITFYCYPSRLNAWHLSTLIIQVYFQLIVWGPTRERAIERMKRALNDTIIVGKYIFHEDSYQ